MTATLEQRLTELETRIAFLDQTVQSLDATVAAQDRILIESQREIAQFRGEPQVAEMDRVEGPTEQAEGGGGQVGVSPARARRPARSTCAT